MLIPVATLATISTAAACPAPAPERQYTDATPPNMRIGTYFSHDGTRFHRSIACQSDEGIVLTGPTGSDAPVAIPDGYTEVGTIHGFDAADPARYPHGALVLGVGVPAPKGEWQPRDPFGHDIVPAELCDLYDAACKAGSAEAPNVTVTRVDQHGAVDIRIGHHTHRAYDRRAATHLLSTVPR